MASPPPANLKDGSTSRKLRLRVDSSLCGLHVARSVAVSGHLTSIHRLELEHTLHRTLRGRSILTRDNSLLSTAALENLDAAGLIRPGLIIDDETILASILKTIESDVGRIPLSPGMVRAADDSLKAPFGWSGAVVAASKYESHQPVGVEPPKNLMGRIAIELVVALPISVGDVLLLSGRPYVIANFADSSEADIFVDALIGRTLEMSEGETADIDVSVGLPPARWATGYRSTGPYSLITQRPLKLKTRNSGQPVTPAHIHSLVASGMTATLAELVTLKSDDVPGRVQLHMAIHGQSEFPDPGTPETFRVMLAELTCLGLKPRLESVGSYTKLFLRPMTDADRLGCSAGSIAKPETLDYRTLKAVPHGLFCADTFGYDDAPERRYRFGHIELPDPIVPWVFRMPMADGEASILSRALRIDDEQIASLLDHRACIDEGGQIVDSRAPGPGQLTGSAAIERRLRALPDDALPQCLAGLAQPRTALVARSILVLPPDLRPMLILSSGNFATSDLNDHYRRLLIRTNRLRKLKELNAPEVIVRNEMRELQKAADCLFANTLLDESGQSTGSSGRPLIDLIDVSLTRLRSGDMKQTDDSGAGRAVCLPSVDSNTVLLPSAMAKSLNVRPSVPVLITRAPYRGEFSVPLLPLKVQIHDHTVIGLHHDSIEALFASSVGINECTVYRLATPAAVAEMAARIGRVQAASTPPPSGWMEEPDLRVVLAKLLRSATSGTAVSFNSPGGILLAGPGSATFSIEDPPQFPQIERARREEGKLVEIPVTWEDAT